MRFRRNLFLAPVLAVVGLAAAAPALSQSYGPGDQELIIAATEFRSVLGSNTAYHRDNDGYLYGLGVYAAPIHLPDGAEISKVCLYAYSMSGTIIGVTGYTRSHAEPGQTVNNTNWGGAVDNFSGGYGVACSEDLSYTLHSTYDPGTGVAHFAHQMEVNVTAAGTNGFGGVRVIWHRQVTPAPPTATFNDVPTSDPGFQFIEALVASGITAGCGGGNYCPDSPLTRRQMAIFLAKGLGLHWPK